MTAHSARQKRKESPWTEEADETLRRAKCDEGLATSRIVRLLATRHGIRVTRNAVLGRALRLGLSRPRRLVAKEPRAPSPCLAKAPDARRPDVSSPLKRPAPVASSAPQGEWKYLLTPTAVPFQRLKAGLCKWPVGEKEGLAQMFCGAVAAGTASYCPGHLLCARVGGRREPGTGLLVEEEA